MTYLDLIKEIRSIGFPCAYRGFPTPPPIPYTVVVFSHNNDVIADNINFVGVNNYRLELYHTTKHPPSEKLIENKLRELRLPFRKSEFEIEEENLIVVVYEVQLLGGY